MTIILNTAEQKLAKYLAKARYERAREANRVNAKVGPQSDDVTDLEGIAAEIAFCKMMNVYPDTEVGHTPDHDATSVQLGGTDVKSTKYKNGKLLARPCKKGKEPDTYALMIGTFPEYRFAGWVPASDLICDDKVTDLGHGPTYALSQSDLNQATAP